MSATVFVRSLFRYTSISWRQIRLNNWYIFDLTTGFWYMHAQQIPHAAFWLLLISNYVRHFYFNSLINVSYLFYTVCFVYIFKNICVVHKCSSKTEVHNGLADIRDLGVEFIRRFWIVRFRKISGIKISRLVQLACDLTLSCVKETHSAMLVFGLKKASREFSTDPWKQVHVKIIPYCMYVKY